MAGHADKKRAKEAAEESSRFFLTVAITLGIYVISRIFLCLGYDSRLPSLYEYFLLAFSFAVLNGAHKWQQDRLLLGVRSSTATDLFFVSLASLVAGSLHPWGWAVWLTVPLYCLYLAGSKLLNWVFTPDTPDDETPEALAFKKKQSKLERKAKSGRYTLVQRGPPLLEGPLLGGPLLEGPPPTLQQWKLLFLGFASLDYVLDQGLDLAHFHKPSISLRTTTPQAATGQHSKQKQHKQTFFLILFSGPPNAFGGPPVRGCMRTCLMLLSTVKHRGPPPLVGAPVERGAPEGKELEGAPSWSSIKICEKQTTTQLLCLFP
ncbi:hypothetical protein Emed_005287 [Eimeria media]